MNPNAIDVERLAARMDAAERQLRAYKGVALGLTALLGALAIFAAAPQSTATQKLVVRDSAGRDRVVILPEGMNFYSTTGALKLFVGQAADGTPLVRMRDGAGVVRADMFVSKDNVPEFALYDNANHPRAIMQASDEPFFGLKDANSNYRASMYLTKNGTPTFDIDRSDGTLLGSLFQDRTNDFGVIALYGKGSNTKRFSAVGSDTPYVALYDTSGKEKWSAP